MADKNGQIWTTANINAEKQRVRGELDRSAEGQKRAARLKVALHRIGELEDDPSDQGLLSRFVYVMSALVHHEASGGLKPRQVKGLLEIAYGILKVKIPRPATSRLANLYGDYYLLRSQLARQDGLHWQAAWDQQMSCHVSGRVLSQGLARQNLAAAIRALRLGEGPVALDLFVQAEAGGLPFRQWVRARLGQIQALRLGGRPDDCRKLISDTAGHADLTESERRDLDWHVLCLDAQQSEGTRLDQLLRSVTYRGSHHEPFYFLEAVLWARASSDKQWRDRLPTLASQARGRSLKVHMQGPLYRGVEAVDACYDTTIPYHLRLDRLGRILGRRQGLISIDKELLVLAAAAVWLTRTRAESLARVTRGEYEAISRRLSGGLSGDALNVFSDKRLITSAA